MALMRTIKRASTKTTGAKTGKVQQQTKVSVTKTSSGTLNSKNRPLTVSASRVSLASSTTLSAMASTPQDKRKILSSLKVSLPKLSSSYLVPKEKLTFTKVPADSIKQSTKKYTPYEKLTGISQDRPEIVMMTQFKPVYQQAGDAVQQINLNNDDDFLTSAGRFLEAQVQLRYLRAQNVFKMLSNVKKNGGNQTVFKDRANKFNDTLNDVYNSATYLLGIVKRLESAKSHLDLRNDIHVVKPDELDALYINNYVGNTNIIANSTKYQLQSSISSKFDINDVMARIGFEKTNLMSYYASTKIWLQLMYEFKQICFAHSLQMIDGNTAAYKNDKSPAVLVKPSVARFAVNPSVEIFPLSELVEIQPEQTSVAINGIDQIFRSLYLSAKIKTPDVKIAALAWTLSREFRFSSGLELPAVTSALSSYYRYTVVPSGNQQVLDAIVGQFGNDIGDVPNSQSNSLVDVAQSRPNANTVVLTFEEKYLVGDNGTLTPGSAYYVDSALEVDEGALRTNRLNDLAVKFEDAHKNFAVIANGMNLFMKTNPAVSGEYSSYLSNPRSLYIDIAQSLVDFNTGKLTKQASDDKLASLLAVAASPSGQRVKAALFALIMCKMHRTYGNHTIAVMGSKISIPTLNNIANDNTATTDKLIEGILDALEAATKPSSAALSRVVSSVFSFKKTPTPAVAIRTDLTLTEETLRSSIKSGGFLLNELQTLMSKILSTFRTNGIDVDRTKFGGYRDTVIMMVAFDLIINIFARYSNQTIIGKFVAYGKPQYSVDITSVVHNTSINDIESRLDTEMQLTQQCTYATLNTLKSLADSVRGTLNYVESQQAIAAVAAVAKVINDEKLVNVLMSQQQLMMLASTVSDLQSQVQSLTSELKSPSSDASVLSVDGNNGFSYEDETKILDDGVVSPKTKLALQGFLADPNFSTTKAINKKIITIGVPVGFTDKLKQQVTVSKSTRSSFTDKQSDIVNVCVLKVDLENPDIVYKAKKYPFELSRFPVRNDDIHPTFANNMTSYVEKFPTRDYTQVFETNGQANDIQYLSPAKNATLAFADDSYSFLTQDQKNSIIYNHTVSFLLEVYVRLMTGLSISEHSFNLLESEKLVGETFAETLTALQLEDTNKKAAARAKQEAAARTNVASNKNKPVVFSAAATSTKQRSNTTVSASTKNVDKSHASTTVVGMKTPSDQQYVTVAESSKVKPQTVTVATDPVKKVPPPPPKVTVATEIPKVRDRSLPLVLQQFATIDEFTRMLTPLADSLQVSRMLLSPKQFDRVFSVIVDPDDFEIDYDTTVLTPHGRDAINQLISKGDVQPVTDSDIAAQRRSGVVLDATSLRSTRDSRFKFRDRDRSSGDAVFEKYFVVIETLGGEVI